MSAARGNTGTEPPIVLVHGWGGSFRRTWQEPGWQALIEDAGRSVIGVDLLGHGDAPKPHEPEAYDDLGRRVLDAMPADAPVDAVGFSLGAHTLLDLARHHPHRFNRLVVAGVGKNLFEEDPERGRAILAAVEGHGDPENTNAQLFAQYANQPGNDAVALGHVLRRRRALLKPGDLAPITCPVLVAIGDKDFVWPADQLVSELKDATLVVIRKCDHFATTENFQFID